MRRPAGTCLAAAGLDGAIRLWDMRSSRLVQYYDAHGGGVTDLAFHPSGAFLLSSSQDSSLKVGCWGGRPGQGCLLVRGRLHGEGWEGAGASCGGQQRCLPRCCCYCSWWSRCCCCCSWSHCYLPTTTPPHRRARGGHQIWDLHEGSLFYTLHGHKGPALAVAFSPTGDLFASAGADDQVLVWRTNFDSPGGLLQHPQQQQQQQQPARSAATPTPSAPPALTPGGGCTSAQAAGSSSGGGDGGGTGESRSAAGCVYRNGSNAAAPGLSLNAGELPDGVAAVLQQVVAQMDVLTQVGACACAGWKWGGGGRGGGGACTRAQKRRPTHQPTHPPTTSTHTP